MPRLGPFLTLSREHHGALLLARDCSRFQAPDAEAALAMNRRIADYWSGEMAAHFAHEETLLRSFPDALASDDQTRLLAEHARLRAACAGAADAGLDANHIREFGALLGAHVRFEERHCFPRLQRVWEASPHQSGPDSAGGRDPADG